MARIMSSLGLAATALLLAVTSARDALAVEKICQNGHTAQIEAPGDYVTKRLNTGLVLEGPNLANNAVHFSIPCIHVCQLDGLQIDFMRLTDMDISDIELFDGPAWRGSLGNVGPLFMTETHGLLWRNIEANPAYAPVAYKTLSISPPYLRERYFEYRLRSPNPRVPLYGSVTERDGVAIDYLPRFFGSIDLTIRFTPHPGSEGNIKAFHITRVCAHVIRYDTYGREVETGLYPPDNPEYPNNPEK